MKKIILISMLLTCFGNTFAQSGDSCSDAIPVSYGDYSYDAPAGTPPPINCVGQYTNGNNGEWYVFSPTEDDTITITTDLASNQGGDSRFHVYTGDCSSLACFAGDDDSGQGYLSRLTISVTANVSYYIVFDNRWINAGYDFSIISSAEIDAPITFAVQNLNTSGTGRASVDLNGDFLDDVVSVSETNINVFFQTTTGFIEKNFSTSNADYLPYWSLAAGDYNGDGYNDLLYGAGSGVTFMKSEVISGNLDNGDPYDDVSYTEYSRSGIFSQRSNFADINNDGNLDAFVCHDVEPNVYFMNDGNGSLNFYQTFQNGAPYVLGDDAAGGNYGSVWIDYDNDRDLDMFIAKCRGGNQTVSLDEMYTNNGDGTFTQNAAALNLEDPMQTWSSAWGDFDNDGDLDVYVGASSGAHKLMRNDLNETANQFTDISSTDNVLALTATSIETCTYDLDNDGYLDLISGSNVLFNNGDMTFSLVSDLIFTSYRSFGDINNDGFIDIITDGGTIYTNNGNNNNWVTINTVGVQSNKNGIGARVELHTPAGIQIREVRSGEGFRFMSTLNTHFGLGTTNTIDSIVIYWPSGTVDTIENPNINTAITVVEGQSLSIPDQSLADLSIYPNPVADVLQINTKGNITNKIASIFDLNGKRLMNTKLKSNQLNVSNLQSGIYMLRLEENGKTMNKKFIKK